MQRVVFIHFVGLEEPVELVPGFKTEQPPQLGLGNVAALEFFERQGFEGAAREIATGCGQPTVPTRISGRGPAGGKAARLRKFTLVYYFSV